MEFGPHHVIIIILRQKHSRTRRISEVDERRLTSLRPMASLCEEQRDESLRFHLGGLMTRSGYLDSRGRNACRCRAGDRQAQARTLANPSENPRGPVFAELTAALDSVRTLKNFCFSNGRIPTARDPIDRNPEVVDIGGGSNGRAEPTDLSRLEAIRDTLSKEENERKTRGDPTLRGPWSAELAYLVKRLNVRLCGYVFCSVRFANDYANHQDYCLRGNNYGAHLRTGLTPVSVPPPFVPCECSLRQAAVPTRRNTEKKEAERMNKRRGEREKENLYKVQEGDRDRRIKSHRAQRPMRVEEGPGVPLTGKGEAPLLNTTYRLKTELVEGLPVLRNPNLSS
ncbi:hypothetical protein ALC57_04176 [Trachymyrmex cornetzi]|uniref:Uncharacterized protein n=1 Tax=Trachymyrmex cornetzi TaxID=471704 RepID=A0A195EDM1_9HYME|nr:hypothetical protein ALC57_04176 [Trachymyrmex cornetzi]